MSDQNENKTPSGQTPAPASIWARQDRPRVGRVGDWNNNNNASSSSSRSGSRGIATLGGRSAGTGSGRGGRQPRAESSDDGDEDDESDEGAKGEDYFAGGERSGISIQGPAPASNRNRGPANPIVEDLLRRAAAGGLPPALEERSQVFSGGGHVLGGDDVDSTYIPDPNAPPDDDALAIRHITLWRQGFQIEDGELMPYGGENDELLRQINQGHAILVASSPLDLLNLQFGERVELRIAKRLNEDYVPPQGPRAFIGSGQRLGAPVPTGAPSDTAMPGEFPPPSSPQPAAERASITTRFEVDQSQPTTSVQIRLADGTRMVSRVNLTHTVGDVRNFINASRPENLTRPYTIATTFPNRVLDDNAQTIEAAKLQNSVVVQRWV